MSKETATVDVPAGEGPNAMLEGVLAEMLRRTLRGWTLTNIALTFERPVRVEVVAHTDRSSPSGHAEG